MCLGSTCSGWKWFSLGSNLNLNVFLLIILYRPIFYFWLTIEVHVMVLGVCWGSSCSGWKWFSLGSNLKLNVFLLIILYSLGSNLNLNVFLLIRLYRPIFYFWLTIVVHVMVLVVYTTTWTSNYRSGFIGSLQAGYNTGSLCWISTKWVNTSTVSGMCTDCTIPFLITGNCLF